MKAVTVRLPDALVAQIDAESRERKMSRSDVIRERLPAHARGQRRRSTDLEAIKDLVGSVEGLPPDLSARRKRYLTVSRYGGKRRR
jgi:Arc/MetJ-type ribon-helix-helix transcriptional regulator